MTDRHKDQRGNLFVAIFGAIALAGVLGGGIMTFSKGPVQNAINMTRKNSVEAEMSIVGQLAIMAATSQANKGDCDGDGYVEPPEWRLVSGTSNPTNGGLIPNTVGAAKVDPWGTPYGYCVWDDGPIILDTACQASPGVTRRLQGTDSRVYPVIAVVSAGPDKTFTTTCRNFSTGTDRADQNNNGNLEDTGDFPLVSKAATTDDDIIYTYTYEGAMSRAGGLWKLKSTDTNTAYIDKKIEAAGAQILGTGTFERMVALGGDFIDVISSIKLPSASNVATCNATNTNIFRRSESAIGVEYCDGSSWVAMGGGLVTSPDLAGMFDAGDAYNSVFVGAGTGKGGSGVTGAAGFGINAGTVTYMNGNTLLGMEAGRYHAAGGPTVVAGYRAGLANTNQTRATAMGAESMLMNAGSYASTAFGYRTMMSGTPNANNTAFGSMALMNLRNSSQNVAIGYLAGKDMPSSASNSNVFVGNLVAMRGGLTQANVAIGTNAMSGNSTAGYLRNTAVGANTMTGASTATNADNTAVGAQALQDLTTGNRNTAVGYQAGRYITTANDATIVGYAAAQYGPDSMTAVGFQAFPNTTGARNTGVVWDGGKVTSGTDNTVIGSGSLMMDGSNNTAVGYYNLSSSPNVAAPQNNTAFGNLALQVTGNDNTALGYKALGNYNGVGTNGGTAIGQNAARYVTVASAGVTAVGVATFGNLTPGLNNTGIGTNVGFARLTSGSNNTIIGYIAGEQLSGSNNTGIGALALRLNNNGDNNTAIGHLSLSSTPDSNNTCIGATSCQGVGPSNVGIGAAVMSSATNGATRNVAAGQQAMGNSRTASAADNVAIGYRAMWQNQTGAQNAAVGQSALQQNTLTNGSVAVGYYAQYNTSGADENVAVGSKAAINGGGATGNTMIGASIFENSNPPGNNNTVMGKAAMFYVDSTSSNNAVMGNASFNNATQTQIANSVLMGNVGTISNGLTNIVAVGSGADVTASNKVRLGGTSITSISGQVAFTVASDRRLKRDIHPTDLGLDFVLKLKPVSYRLIDGNGRIDYGFLAQDVDAALMGRKTNMVTRANDKMGTYRLRSDDLIAPLVRAVQEQQEMLETLEKRVDSLN